MSKRILGENFDAGGAPHVEEPDEEQLRTLWCGGLNEKVTEEVRNKFKKYLSSPLVANTHSGFV